jgi:putative tricarboxylic transport membrane protein
MKCDDALVGAVLLALAIAIVGYAQTFPTLGGMAFGPDLFPTLLGAGLGLCGLALITGGLLRRRAEPERAWIEVSASLRKPAIWSNAVVVLGALVFYIVVSDWLGFHLTAMIVVSGVMWKLGVWPPLILLFAGLAPLAMHYVFYSLLRVPLPWGVLTPIAW